MTTYRVLSTAGGGADGTTWTDAYTSIETALGSKTSSDTLWVGPSHARVKGSAITWTAPTSYGLRILGVDSDSTEPATALNSTPAAYESVGNVTGSAFVVNNYVYAEKIKLISSSWSSISSYLALSNITSSAATQLWKNCAFEMPTTHSSAGQLLLGAGAAAAALDSRTEISGCSVKFGSANGSIYCRQTRAVIDNLSIDGTGSTPTTLFKTSGTGNSGAGSLWCRDSDLSGVSWTNLFDISITDPYDATFISCKFPSGFAFSTGTHAGRGGLVLRCHQCASGDSQIGFYELTGAGTVVEETGIYIDSGDITMKMTPSSNVSFPGYPLVARFRLPIASADTGSPQSITVKMVTDRATALDNDEVAVLVHALDSSGTSLASVTSSEATDVFATPSNLTSNSDTWTGTGGFTNEQKRQVTVSFTPQEAGDLEIEVCVFAALTNPLYVLFPVALD